MRTLKVLLSLLVITLPGLQQLTAQKATYTTRGGIIMGFGFGGAYQQSDIANSRGAGFDFTFGSQLYRREGALLSADWKFRFLAGENQAFDHHINLDDTYSNIDYKFFTYDLELGLTLNRLRERTRIVVTGFAGGGITHGRTFTDLFDSNHVLYDFSAIDPNRSRDLVYKDLKNLSDRDFETAIFNRAALMPTAGLYLGYQFSPSFSIGIEHKTNFSLTEENSFAGINMDNIILAGSRIDMNHYTTLGFVWKLGRLSSSGGSPVRPVIPEEPVIIVDPSNNIVPVDPVVTPVVTPVEKNPPAVRFTNPASDPFRTSSEFISLKAEVLNVVSYDDIEFYQDGIQKSSFTYSGYSKTFTANVELHGGENRFRIVVSNSAGRAEDRLVIIMDETEPVIPPPSVRFTDPPGPRYNSESRTIEVAAMVINVDNRDDISLSLNGRNISFSYLPSEGILSARIDLAEGNNALVVTAANPSGTASDRLSVL